MLTNIEARKKLEEGNLRYVAELPNTGDVSSGIRRITAEQGQHPFAVVIACSDSRVIPEEIFSVGIGEIFTVRIAGNVIDKHQLGSIEYAVSHLGTPLVVVLGHTKCGAVSAAISRHSDGYIRWLTDEIEKAIGDEKDPIEAACLNTEYSADIIRNAFAHHREFANVHVQGALYDIETGVVRFLDNQ